MITATLLVAALNIVSCNPNELMKPGLESYSISTVGDTTIKNRDDKAIKNKVEKNYKAGFFDNAVVGDTVLTYNSPKKLKPTKLPDLTKHKNANIPELKGKAFKMVAAGSNLMLGMRDGGIFNEGMLTSFPNLIANQMGIDFNNALFDPADYNGSGKKVYSSFNPTAGPVVKQKHVNNNLGYENGKLKRFSGLTDNYFISKGGYSTFTSDANFSRMTEPLWVNSNNKSKSFASTLQGGTNKFDFLLFENGLQDVIFGESYAKTGIEKYSLAELQATKVKSEVKITFDQLFGQGSELYSTIFKLLVSQQLNKGVIINCPDLEDLPYYKTNFLPQIKKLEETYRVNTGLTQYALVLGDSKVDSLLSPRVNINSKPWVAADKSINKSEQLNLITQDALIRIREVIQVKNQNSKVLSEYASMPIFDINSFYKNIAKGNFISPDGIKVDTKWPGGNFYSSDGVYPSAFGQAIIANEVIKVMNAFYKMDVPFIATAEYLK